MSIKGGDIIHSANGVVIDRLQTAGPSGLNIPEEKIYETGNYQTVATVRDIPEVTFDMESFDVSTEVEALLTGVDPTTTVSGDEFDFLSAMPIDVVSPWKGGQGSFAITKGIIVPYLTLERATYRFGVGQSSTQQFQLRTDGIYYVPGSPYFQEFTITAGANQVYALSHAAIPFEEEGELLYALSVCVKNPSTGAYKRLFLGDDYTNTTTQITVLANQSTAGYTKMHVCYGSLTAASYPQSVHQGVSVKPAAVRGKDIDIYLSTASATAVLSRWRGVQTFEANWSVSLQNDEELGNHKYVATDYDVAEVAGTIEVKSVDASDFMDKIAQVTNVPSNQVAGVQSSAPIEVEARIKHPDTGSVLKTIYIPDARIKPPAVSARVQQKLSVPFPFTSDSGTMLVYQGSRP